MVFRVAVTLLEIHQNQLMQCDNFEDIMNYMKNNMPDIDNTTMDKVMKDVFSMDIKKQLIEYQVEYNVLQEEINTAQHYMESLNREKENSTQLESKLQVSSHFIQTMKIKNKIKIFLFFSLPNRVLHNWKRHVRRSSHKFNRCRCKYKAWKLL